MSLSVSLFTLLLSSYFNDYALKAEVISKTTMLEAKIESKREILQQQINAEKAVRDKEIALLKNSLVYLKNGQSELKDMLKQALQNER